MKTPSKGVLTMNNNIAGEWVMNPEHSDITFSVRYLTKRVEGSFGEFSGEAHVKDDVAQSTVTGKVDVATLTTGDMERDTRIRSSEFFDVENYPTVTFRTHSWNKSEASEQLVLEGELTIKDVTHPVTFTGEFNAVELDSDGVETADLELTTKIDRTNWGLKWDSPADTGGIVLGEEVTIVVKSKAHRVEPESEFVPLSPEPSVII